jgi:hypothetical protein
MNVWPNTIRGMSWPKDGMTYSYEHRGYIRPEKLEHWLTTAFGVNRAKYVVRRATFHRFVRQVVSHYYSSRKTR